MTITVRKQFTTHNAAETWVGTFTRTGSITLGGTAEALTWRQGKVECHATPNGTVYIGEITGDTVQDATPPE